MRNSFKTAIVLALVTAVPAFAASTVAYQACLGGDPHVAQYEQGQYPAYTGDNPADNQTFNVGTPLNWSVRASVSGTHSTTPAGGLGDGFVPVGIANAVITLEVRDSQNNVVDLQRIQGTANSPSSAGWYSVINDGDTDGARGLIGADPLQNAAFASVFSIGGNGANGGRLFDTSSNGGPYMDYYHYPSCTGLPAAATNCNGKLIGMGAGYSSFIPTSFGGPNTAGVGLTGNSGACVGLGTKVLFEGQISTTGLAAGTYTLTVTPGQGTNVCPYTAAFCTFGPASTFAVAPNSATGDSITFVLGGGTPLSIVSSVSRKTHGTAGDFDVASGGWEGRVPSTSLQGPSKIVTTFNQNIARVNNNNSDVSVSSGTVGSIVVAGSTLTVNLTGITNRATFTIGYPGIAAASGGSTTAATNCWQVLAGEASGGSPLVVNTSDFVYVRGRIGMAVSASTFRADVNADGAINTSDFVAIRGRIDSLFSMAATCP